MSEILRRDEPQITMATYRDLHFDWSMLCQDCTDCWTTTGNGYFVLLYASDYHFHCFEGTLKTFTVDLFN
jgi:hypothetical protein